MQKHCIKIIHKNIQPALCILNAIIIYHTCVHIEYNSIRHMEQQIIVFRVFEINSNIIRALCNNDALRKLSRHKSYLRNVKVQRNKKRGGGRTLTRCDVIWFPCVPGWASSPASEPPSSVLIALPFLVI